MKNYQFNLKHIFYLFTVSLLMVGCSSDDDGTPDDPGEPDPTVEPVVLDCDFFQEGNIHLEKVPNAIVDYIVTCDPKIKGDLIIDEGVVIEFERNAGLQMIHDNNYKIQMNGTVDNPILLTGVEKTKGYWRGLLMTSDDPTNVMKHVTVEYAGQQRPGGWGYEGAVIGSWGAVMSFDNCTIQHCQEIGLHWVGYSAELNIYNSIFTKNDLPIKTNPNFINSIDETSTYQGNINDYVRLEHTDVNKDITFHNIDVPFFSNGFKPSNGAKRTFTFKPGVTILMDAGSQMRFQNAFSYQHETIMIGTPEDRITIKGKEDVPGYWKGLSIESDSPLNEIAYLDIANAGRTTAYPNGAINLGYSSYLKIENVNFIDCFEYAMSLDYRQTMFYLEYDNLVLDNTPKLFSDRHGVEVADPHNP
ncbi:hypothetical protein [Psychroflexus halocasei]|uniref:Right handed beta helix region n=1 Tax=Psychroflexus halocasei TaxID=908615 RepID=A0A1H4AGL1_9FLAO|nr:hypothetical protein [Psychroflexus halocasei]SEA34918.1 hypothetical protein SAMN05421540_10524 [Psychroflexus halocasei]